MNFGSSLLKGSQSGFNFIGDMLSQVMNLLAKPLSYIFVALLQFFVAIVAGFFRVIYSMLTINYDAISNVYPGESYTGIQTVMDLLRPTGMLTVVPYIVLAVIWFAFIKKLIGLIGGAGGSASD
jgi:hypothetical protein